MRMLLGLCVVPAILVLLAAGPPGEEVYTWTDADGSAHYTNDPNTIPQRYRDKARTLDGRPAASTEPTPPPAAETKPGSPETAPKPPAAKPQERTDEPLEESAPPPLSISAAETLDEAGWRKRFVRATERVHRAELALSRDKQQLSRVANEEGYMVVDAYGRTMTAGRSTALRMQMAEDERVLNEAREALQDLERVAAREAIPLEWRR
jgi:Domain of unknown function (DUF4124)